MESDPIPRPTAAARARGGWKGTAGRLCLGLFCGHILADHSWLGFILWSAVYAAGTELLIASIASGGESDGKRP